MILLRKIRSEVLNLPAACLMGKSQQFPRFVSLFILLFLILLVCNYPSSAVETGKKQALSIPLSSLDSSNNTAANNTDSDLIPGTRYAHVPKGFLPELEYDRPDLGIALSGGGARGLAAIGFLEVLEEENIPVDLMVGTSIGAVVAGLYSMGYNPAQMEKISRKLDWSTLFSDAPHRRNLFLAQKEYANQELLTLRFKGLQPYIPDAIFTGETLFLKILQLSMDAPFGGACGSFNQLKIPIGIIATDLATGRRVIMDTGDMPMAIRASMAIPIVFRPLRYKGKLLVDGGSVENIPVHATFEQGADLVIAYDCSSPAVPNLNPDSPWEIANQVTTLMTVDNDSIARARADLVIKPDLGGFTQTDFDDVKEIIEIGRNSARNHLPELLELIEPDLSQPKVTVQLDEIVIGALPSSLREEALKRSKLTTGLSDTRTINRGLESILKYLRELGFSAACLNAKIDEDNVLVIAVEPGIVRDIRIEGVPSRRQGLAMRDVEVKRGQPLRSKDLLKSLTKLHATGRYTVAYSYLEHNSEGGITVVFLLEEAPFPKLGIGLGFDSDRQARYFANLVTGSALLRQGEEITLRGIYGIRDEKYGMSIRMDRLAKTYLGWEIGGWYAKREQDMFDFQGEVLDVFEVLNLNGYVTTVFNLSTWGKLSAGIKSERVQQDYENHSWSTMILNSFTLRANLDTEDRKPFPRSGAKVGIAYDSYITQLGSERSFNKLDIDAEAVIPVFHRNVARIAGRSSVSDLTTPMTHRFRVGGITDFPALKPDRFVALRRVSGTFEWRYDLISRYVADAYLLARYDLTAFSDAESWRPKSEEFIHSYAGGFALDTFLGPMEIWYAWSPESDTSPQTDRLTVNLGFRF